MADVWDQFPDAPARGTSLAPDEEAKYRKWLGGIGMTREAGYNVDENFSGTDYDLRGFYKKYGPANINVRGGQHFPDEFKLPNHQTFSDESKFATGADAAKAGHWNGDQYAAADPWAQFPDAQQASAEPAKGKPVGSIADAITEPAMHLGSSMFATPASGYAGLVGGPQAAERTAERFTYQPRTQAGQVATDAVTWPLRQFEQFADFVGTQAGTPRPGALTRANLASGGVISKDYKGGPEVAATVKTAMMGAPALFMRRSLSRGGKPAEVSSDAGTRPVRDPVAPRAQETPPAAAKRPAGLEGVPPSIEELTKQSKAAYKRASDAGINIAPASFHNLKNRIGAILTKEGLDPTLHPSTTAAFKRIAETKGELSLEQLETLRKIGNDAKGSQAADSRLASILVDEIDDYVARLGKQDVTKGDPKAAAALKEARDLYSRKKKAEEINTLIERARLSAPNFSASGMENALRTEFRSLAKNEKRMRRFTPEERAAIKKVATGGKVENALRMIGKMAPMGPVSGMFGILTSAAVPGGAALPLAGLAGRYAATRMTTRNALRAEETMRRGPQQARRNALVREGA
jgi:hypothetical protein